MKPKVLVCAHSDVQFRTLVHNCPFFHMAHRHEVLRRIYEPGDLIGLADSLYLFLLPDWEKGTQMIETVIGYWTTASAVSPTEQAFVRLTGDQVIGRVPFVPPDDAPWSNLYRPKHYVDKSPPNTFPDFPKYFGPAKREPYGEAHHEFHSHA